MHTIQHRRIRRDATTRRYLDFLFALIVGMAIYPFYLEWGHRIGSQYLYIVSRSLEQRPFVYRILLPLLSRGLAGWTGMDVVTCLVLLVAASAIALYFSMKYLYTSFYQDGTHASLIAFLGCVLLFALIWHESKIYDVATACFFALSLALMARGKVIAYLLLFPIVTLNRETSFLLGLFYCVHTFDQSVSRRWLYGTAYQAVTWWVIRALTMLPFTSYPGYPLYVWRPTENLQQYVSHPFLSIILLSVFTLVLLVGFHQWKEKPLILRTAFVVIFPLQVFLHFTMGYPWELRVYAEVFPVAFLLVMQSESALLSQLFAHPAFAKIPRVPAVNVKTSRTSLQPFRHLK